MKIEETARTERWHFLTKETCIVIRLLDGGEWKIPSLMIGVEGLYTKTKKASEAWDALDSKIEERIKENEIEDFLKVAFRQAGEKGKAVDVEEMTKDAMQAFKLYTAPVNKTFEDVLRLSAEAIYAHLICEQGAYDKEKISFEEWFKLNTVATIEAGFNWINSTQTPAETRKIASINLAQHETVVMRAQVDAEREMLGLEAMKREVSKKQQEEAQELTH